MAITDLAATFNFTIRQQRAVVATPLDLNRVQIANFYRCYVKS